MFAKVRAADACVLILNVQNRVDEQSPNFNRGGLVAPVMYMPVNETKLHLHCVSEKDA